MEENNGFTIGSGMSAAVQKMGIREKLYNVPFPASLLHCFKSAYIAPVVWLLADDSHSCTGGCLNQRLNRSVSILMI